MWYKYLFWIMVALQVAGWIWFSYKAGKLNDKQFYLFTILMLIGQTGTAAEGYFSNPINWGAVGGQGFFFAVTLYGSVQRFRQARKEAL